MEVKRFVQEIGFEIFFLCHEINHLRIKFWEINTLVASYVLAFVTLEMWLSVDFGHCFNNKFWTLGIFKSGLKFLESRHPELEFEHKFWISLTKIERVIVVWI